MLTSPFDFWVRIRHVCVPHLICMIEVDGLGVLLLDVLDLVEGVLMLSCTLV